MGLVFASGAIGRSLYYSIGAIARFSNRADFE
jgi:hypothetical protein